jgi:hypothetical protein
MSRSPREALGVGIPIGVDHDGRLTRVHLKPCPEAPIFERGRGNLVTTTQEERLLARTQGSGWLYDTVGAVVPIALGPALDIQRRTATSLEAFRGTRAVDSVGDPSHRARFSQTVPFRGGRRKAGAFHRREVQAVERASEVISREGREMALL